MRLNNQALEAWIAGQRERNRRRLTALGTRPVEQLSDGADVDSVAGERLSECELEVLAGELLEQLAEAFAVGADVAAALGDAVEKDSTARGHVVKAIENAVLAAAPLAILETADMVGV